MFANNSVCGLVWVCPTSHKFLPIPLKSVSLTASVVHAVAQVEITQVYANSEENPIEACYIFPLDSNGAVTHFHAELDGKVIKGVVKSSQDAQKDYNDAIQNQQTAFLGEEIKPDVFQLKVGFLKPGAVAKVVLGYVTEVKNDPDSHAIRFIIPTTVAPRYVPASSTDKKSMDLANMTFSSAAPAPLDIKVVASIQGEISSVESLSSHKILVESKGLMQEQPGNWNKVVVTLAGNVTEMDRDFVLLVSPAEAVMNPRVYYEVLDSGSVAAMAHLIPSFALKEEKVELVIVVDRSGSMEGNSIRLASASLQLFIHSLPHDCYFNIVGFGSSYEFLFKEGSKKYDQKSLTKAEKCAKSLDAELGGTEILEPLKKIYSKPPISGYSRQIFVITDGEVSNTEEVIGLVKRNAHNSRLFALGIGASSSRHLVQGMASAGGGTCAFVEQDDSIQRATLSQLKNALQPALTDIKIEWLGLPVPLPIQLNTEKTLFGYNKPLNPTTESVTKIEEFSQAPKIIPPIFDGNQMVVFGLFPPSMGRPNGVKIIANSPDGPLTLEIEMNENNNLGKTEMLHKLAVIKLIRELELEETAMYDSTRFQDQIVALGVEHGITSKYTSFIAIDESNKKVVYGKMQNRQIQSQLPLSYVSRSYMPSTYMPSTYIDMSSSLVPRGAVRGLRRGYSCTPIEPSTPVGLGRGRGRGLARGSRDSPPLPVEHGYAMMMLGGCNPAEMMMMDDKISEQTFNNTKSGRVIEIINQEQFNGSFLLTETLCQALGISYEDVKDEAFKKGWDPSLWATSLAITCLTTTDLKEEKELWELAVNKAEKWMVQNCSDANILQDIRTTAKLIFTNLN